MRSVRVQYFKIVILNMALLFMGGCASKKSYDYSNFQKYSPRSILVLPPENQGTDIRGSYGFLSTVSRPIAEMGYYVFPVQIVDQFLKENGMPTPGDMHRVSLKKVEEIIGPDAVLYLALDAYGSEYQLINSQTKVSVRGRLVDTKSGVLLWEGSATASESSNNQSSSLLGAVIGAAVSQAVRSGLDRAHDVSKVASVDLFQTEGTGLLAGPYKK